MNEGMRDDAILREAWPSAGFLGVRWSLTVMPFQIGIVIQDGEVVDVFESGKRNLPGKGEVRTYVASTAPFTLTFWLMDPMDREEPDDGVVLGQPVLTSDDEAVTGRLVLTMRVVRENVEHLMKLRPGSGVVTRRDVSDVIKDELLDKVLALDIHRYTAEELRGNRELFRGIYESVNIELASTIRFYGLRLDNFTVNWGLTSEERERIRERRHEEELREIKRRHEVDEVTERKPRRDSPAPPVIPPATPPTLGSSYWVYEDRVTSQAKVHDGGCRYCNHGAGMGRGRIPGDSEWYGPYGSLEEAFRRAEATGQKDVRGCKVCRPHSVDGEWEEIGYSFKNGRKSMQNVPDWVRKQIPKYNRMFHTTDPHSRRTSYYLDGRNVTYRISFARVHGGADVRISRTLRENSGAVSNEPPPDHGGQANASYYTPPRRQEHLRRRSSSDMRPRNPSGTDEVISRNNPPRSWKRSPSATDEVSDSGHKGLSLGYYIAGCGVLVGVVIVVVIVVALLPLQIYAGIFVLSLIAASVGVSTEKDAFLKIAALLLLICILTMPFALARIASYLP